MDEVDFTILAATSVLGDLIEKCPPAEACRDAFDRMSKATVQMCLSTTGFSSSAQGGGLNSRRRPHSQNSVQHQQQQQPPPPQQQQENTDGGTEDYFSGNQLPRQSRGPSR